MDEQSKLRHSKRILQKENYAKKQAKIAKAYGMTVKSVKHCEKAAVNCGNPKCIMCSNPRKLFSELTIQEQSFAQTDRWQD